MTRYRAGKRVSPPDSAIALLPTEVQNIEAWSAPDESDDTVKQEIMAV